MGYFDNPVYYCEKCVIFQFPLWDTHKSRYWGDLAHQAFNSLYGIHSTLLPTLANKRTVNFQFPLWDTFTSFSKYVSN